MARAAAGTLALVVHLLVVLPKLITAAPQSMCFSQFALANQACSVMPPREEDAEVPSHVGLMHEHRRRDDEHEHRPEHGHGHGHGHGNGHGDGHGEHPRANEDCCRWLKEVDHACVCEALLRLPVFLIKPKHSYTLSVGSTCDFAFECEGV